MYTIINNKKVIPNNFIFVNKTKIAKRNEIKLKH